MDRRDFLKLASLAATLPALAFQSTPSQLKITEANDDFHLGITFSNYGSPTPIAAPSEADVLPAPAGLYQALDETTS